MSNTVNGQAERVANGARVEAVSAYPQDYAVPTVRRPCHFQLRLALSHRHGYALCLKRTLSFTKWRSCLDDISEVSAL